MESLDGLDHSGELTRVATKVVGEHPPGLESGVGSFAKAPKAGLGAGRYRTVSARLRREGIAFAAGATMGPGDATALARMAALGGAEVVVCVGGDGTVQQVGETVLDFIRHYTGPPGGTQGGGGLG